MSTVAIGKRQNFEFLQPPHSQRDPPSAHGEDDWEARAGLILFSALTLALTLTLTLTTARGPECRHIKLDYLWLQHIALPCWSRVPGKLIPAKKGLSLRHVQKFS
jgi:hypothetical protein